MNALHAIFRWNTKVKGLLKAQNRPSNIPQQLYPIPNQNMYIDKENKLVYKSSDYRSLVGKSEIDTVNRRSPEYYFTRSKVKDAKVIVSITNPISEYDSLSLITYQYVERIHMPPKSFTIAANTGRNMHPTSSKLSFWRFETSQLCFQQRGG